MELDREILTIFDESCGRVRFDDEGVSTATSDAQFKVENNVSSEYKNKNDELPFLKRSLHIEFLLNTVRNLPSTYEVIDSSRTWIVYWSVHSLYLLNYEFDTILKDDIVRFLKSCQHIDGGFGGGPGQEPHLATTYAAVNALCIIGTEDALTCIDRKGLLKFLNLMKVGDGSFYMHRDGEIDIRGIYCSAVLATILNLNDSLLFDKSDEWVCRCQTYEGGFSGGPGMEAHGGYTFCGICSLYLLGCLDRCDKKSLGRWILNRQTSFEGGFQGRTNKLVDSCYSFWQGASLALLNCGQINELSQYGDQSPWNFDNTILQEYLLICCQHIKGGFIDKPTTKHDPYHTCYSLSGLSIAQTHRGDLPELDSADDNKLVDIHPVYNLPMIVFKNVQTYFKSVK